MSIIYGLGGDAKPRKIDKISFKNDYSELCHEKVLKDLLKINRKQFAGYSLDEINESAKFAISRHFALDSEKVDMHFFATGIQCNSVFIRSVLKPFEAVIACDTAHICVHETGAIESNGNKICVAPNHDGKLRVEDIEKIVDAHSSEHMVRPKLVFISQSTELGTIYTKKELESIYKTCKQLGLHLYIDGARLGSALTSSANDVKKQDIKKLCDAFYIGGNKNGSPFGECLVIINDDLKSDFRLHMKQKGALIAKGYLLASCFKTLFEGNLFFKLAKHANLMADKIRNAIVDSKMSQSCGFARLTPTRDYGTNMIFAVLPNSRILELLKNFDFYVVKKFDENHSVIRIVTSWATKEVDVDKFIGNL